MFPPDKARDLVAAEFNKRISEITSEIYKIKEATIRDAMELRGFSTQPDYIKDHISRELHSDGIERYFHDRALFLEIENFFGSDRCKWIIKSTQHFDHPVEVQT